MGDAWDLADTAAERAGVGIEPLTTLADVDAVNEVIAHTWGGQVMHREVVRAFQHAGCVLYGARPKGAPAASPLVGFVFGFLGFQGGMHCHSHMLAVVGDRRAGGVGFALKLAQRAACLEIGVEEVRWTFDPMIRQNAWLNLMKLRAVGTAFFPHFYGDMGDALNRGERSDRFEVRWSLADDRVRVGIERAVGGGAPEVPPANLDRATALLRVDGEPARPRPVTTGARPDPSATVATVAIPRDHLALRAADRALAARWRDAAADAFGCCFDAGLVATAITPDGRYVFEREPT
jgi:predicted GNAT superfamily acetyltransferase